MFPRVAVALLAAAAVLAGCSSSGGRADYLQRLDDAGLSQYFDDGEDAVDSAEAACTLRGNGQSSGTVIDGLMERGMTQAEGRQVYEAAAAAFCPDVL